MGWLDNLVFPLLVPLLIFITNYYYEYWKNTWTAVKFVRDPPQYQEYIVIREKELKELKELFDGFLNHDNTVNAVYLLGVPGSGKTELARQYGNFANEKHGVSTVITLNAEGSDAFRKNILQVLKKIPKLTIEQIDVMQKWNISDLMDELQQLLQKRPGWLLIVDNIRDPNIAQNELYKELPRPGTDKWGTGMMLVTTQVPLHREDSTHVRIKRTNDGLTSDDATKFLCRLATKNKSSRVCDKKVATDIVKELECLPLSIFAAGIYIESSSMKSDGSYNIDNYLAELKSWGIPHGQDLKPTESEYKHSMLAALQLTVNQTIMANSEELPADVFLDFMALIGYTAGEGTISSSHVVKFIEMMRVRRDPLQKHQFPITLRNFPLVDFWEEKRRYWAHQVVRYAFRAALERSGVDLLLYTFGNISHYLATEHKSDPDDSRIVKMFQCFVENLPSQYCHQNSCIIPSENYTEYQISLFLTAIRFNGRVAEHKHAVNSPLLSLCHVFETFLVRVRRIRQDNPNSVSPFTLFNAYAHQMHVCYKGQDEKQSMVATTAIDLIKEVAPERSELHTAAASKFLLDHGSGNWHKHWVKSEVFSSFLCSKNATDMYFKVRDIRRVVEYFQKLCLSLSEFRDAFQLTSIYSPFMIDKINYKAHTLISISKMASAAVHIESVATIMSQCFISYYDDKAIIHDKKLPNELHIGLGRRYQLGQYGIKQSYVSGNLYGACSSKQVYTVKDFGPSLIFYIDYDIRIGLKNTEISVFNKYFEVFNYFIPMLREFKTILHKLIFTQENSELEKMICQVNYPAYCKLREMVVTGLQPIVWSARRRIKLPFRDKILLLNDHLLCVSMNDEFLVNYTIIPDDPVYTTILSGDINTIDRVRQYVYNDAMAFSIRELLCYQRPEEATEILFEIFDAIMYAFRTTTAD